MTPPLPPALEQIRAALEAYRGPEDEAALLALLTAYVDAARRVRRALRRALGSPLDD